MTSTITIIHSCHQIFAYRNNVFELTSKKKVKALRCEAKESLVAGGGGGRGGGGGGAGQGAKGRGNDEDGTGGGRDSSQRQTGK